ncbi:uncharacterized protein LOC129973050 [Argiope bruennichi]|uniref:Histone H2A n=1 Tax=Argiope bruennichi TaxID=94029 RepID=A0A8T0E1V0_ARGBR|nr:uncharacterized protein LOC129973050 [Argiope bruennichi]KAF8764115.1 Histone H2AX like protein [Argiope bruennichi]
MAKKRTSSPLPDSAAKSKKRAKSDRPDSKSGSKTGDFHSDQTKRFPLQKIQDMLTRKFSGTVKPEAAVFLTAILEYLSVEILELSANVARNRSNNPTAALKLTLGDTLEAIESDPEIKELIVKVKNMTSNGDK